MAAQPNLPSLTVRVQRAPGVLWRDGDFGVVLLAPGMSEPATITGTGRELWRALAEPRRPGDLAAELAAAFGEDPARVEADITPVLAELRSIGAVEEVRP